MATYKRPDAALQGYQKSVAASASSVVLLPMNSGGRRGASVFNDSTAICYLLCGDQQASTTCYSAQVAPYGYFEVPYGYRGPIKGIWASATGSARVTEYI
jgi:hypothetical protein